jgi:hypothetical protein
MCDDDGMPPWPWAHCDFDLWAVAGEGWERGFYEGVHAAGGSPPVAVVEAEGFAGEDEGADAILCGVSICSVACRGAIEVSGHTWALATVLMADRGMVTCDGGFCDDNGCCRWPSRNFGVATSRENWRLC